MHKPRKRRDESNLGAADSSGRSLAGLRAVSATSTDRLERRRIIGRKVEMKKSGQVTLTIVAAMALAGCARRYDPCAPETFNELACQEGIRRGGYSHPYPYYYDGYHSYMSHGGSAHSSSSGVARGGFGSTGSHGGS